MCKANETDFLAIISVTSKVIIFEPLTIELSTDIILLLYRKLLIYLKWYRGIMLITTAQLIQQSLNSGSARVQILLAAYWRFAIVRTSDSGPDWK